MHTLVRTLARCGALLLTVAALPAGAALVTWHAAGGLTPDAADAQWQLTDSASPENPALSAGVLNLGGNQIAEQMYYSMSGANTDFSGGAAYWLEARLRVNSQSLTGGWWRAPVSMAIGFNGGGLAIFELRRDSIYLRNGDNSQGALNNSVDTDSDFHLYRMEVLGSAVGSTVNVYQDGVLVLSDNSVYNAGGGNRVFWGDASIIAGGQSDWTYVATNLGATPTPTPPTQPMPEPGSLALAALALLAARAVRPPRPQRSA